MCITSGVTSIGHSTKSELGCDEDRCINVKVLNALSGDVRCVLPVAPSWTLSRLRAELALREGTPAHEQRLLLPGVPGQGSGPLEHDGQTPAFEALAGSEVLHLLRVCASPAGDGGAAAAGLKPGALRVIDGAGQPGAPAQVVAWAIDAGAFLRGSPCEASPIFQLQTGTGLAYFRLFVVPADGESFKGSKGRGRLQLKCQSDPTDAGAPLRFSVSVEGPVESCGSERFAHDFGYRALWKGPAALAFAPDAAGAKVARLPRGAKVIVRLENFDCAGDYSD
uniref:Ubiquitin-like domain-containing protein n=1 Tax=Zooxanthella nutricula TaxID=1333877 RepID=A0A7S2QDG3_9DINO